MSEEEKQAIEYLQNQDNSLNWNYGTLQAILQVLNYIDKLQKREIKLNELLSDREIEVAGRDIKINKLQKELDNSISKDKIKDKIEELEELFDKNEKEITIQYQNQFIVDVVGVLEELLEK